MTDKVCDQRPETQMTHSPLFSLKSHRLRICLFLLLALYMGSANRMALSTGIVASDPDRAATMTSWRWSAKIPIFSITMFPHAILLPCCQGHLSWTPSQQSFLLSSSFYGSFITIFVSGAVIDQFSPSKILSVGLIVSAVLTVVAPFLADISYEVLVGSRMIIGMAESFIVPAINMLATRWFPTSEKTTLAALYTSGLQFAAGGASLLAAQICRSTTLQGWPAIFYIFGAVTLIFVVIWFIFVNDRPSVSRWTSETEKKYLEKHIVANKKKPSLRTSPWKALATSIPVHSILLCSFAFGFSTSTMQAYLPTYLREQLALPVDKIGLYTLAPFVAQIIAKTMCGPLTDYVARKGITSLTTATKVAQSLGSFGASGALMAFAYFPTCEQPGSALPILIIYGAVYAGGVCGFFTSLLTIAPKYTGTLSALSQLFSMLACIVSSTLVTTLTTMETPYKWPIVFGTASVLQAGAGAHYLFCGSTEQQYWSDGPREKAPSV
ncbi:hypothetical protein PRIPAC_97576 [Pristionchus pacificus]|uniref:Membrane transporter n=1 Tax=Pristionchus pacificus TaxID=54126 RepID=A0A2A6CGP8_PRIPA|nr:hypothetical protein PRIPAC_97576 [Pristionchus pacificus]|eukprot:PDM77394.1 membrane transporter [Pristionchus pacificus]